MKSRSSRLETIKRVIRAQRIESQESLLSELESQGFSVTQATLSRDLKILKVGKISDGAHGYYYTLPGDEEIKDTEESYIHDIERGFISIEFSVNIGVMKTMPGHADSVALAFDRIGLASVAGTIAGDDTIFFVLREEFVRDDFYAEIKNLIPELKGM